jgi:hypothetical protein
MHGSLLYSNYKNEICVGKTKENVPSRPNQDLVCNAALACKVSRLFSNLVAAFESQIVHFLDKVCYGILVLAFD